MKETTPAEARADFDDFDAWAARAAIRTEITPVDIAVAGAFLRRLDLSVRTLDAIHIAAVERIGAALVTFDQRMAAAARTLGVAVADA